MIEEQLFEADLTLTILLQLLSFYTRVTIQYDVEHNGDETPNDNTRTSDKENNNSNNNNTANGTKRRKKKKKKGNDDGGGLHDESGKAKFEGQLKEEAFKGIVLECGKPAIQARIIRESCITYANAQKQPHVADSIFYKTPIQRSDFVNAVEDPTAYQYDNSGTTKEDPYKKKAEEQRVSFLLDTGTQSSHDSGADII